MSALLPLKDKIIYGPVRSRRLGRSLGINILPAGRKWCTFDCLYCQYGWTPSDETGGAGPRLLPTLTEVMEAVETAVRGLDEPPAYLTFSGNGEPTLHPDFPGIAQALLALKARIAPKAKTAVLSNSSRVGDPAVRRAIALLDRPIMKLDAGNERMFRAYSRPSPDAAYDEIIAGLARMRGITLQALFTSGPQGNLGASHVADWIESVKTIRPSDVQIYTISRPVPSGTIAPATPSAMLDIRERLRTAGLPAEVYS